MPARYVVVLGSLLSGIGKGIVSSSIVKLLSIYDINTMPLKFDGYLNYDCGTMRLGSWEAKVMKDSFAHEAYGKELIQERHRHRYEFNNDYRDQFEKLGLRISATTTDDRLVEIIEWTDPFGIATQAHPELKSRPERPAPIFVSFIKHAAGV